MLHLFETWGAKDKNSALLIVVKNPSPCVSAIPHLKTDTKPPAFYMNIWLLMVHLPTLCSGKTVSDLASLLPPGDVYSCPTCKEKQVAVGETTCDRLSSLH